MTGKKLVFLQLEVNENRRGSVQGFHKKKPDIFEGTIFLEIKQEKDSS